MAIDSDSLSAKKSSPLEKARHSFARVLKSKVAAAVASTKSSLADGAELVQRQARETFEIGDRYVHNRPWEAIGIAALTGLAVGFLASRR